MELRKKEKGRLYIISGPSGTGKGTICNQLVSEGCVELSVSATTRNPRPGEINGKSYYFLTEEEFKEKIGLDGFLEYAEVFGNYYGTPRGNVIDRLNRGIDVILEIDIQGAMQIRETYPEGIFIFILPPSMKELRRRIESRGTETEDVINLRLSKALKEMSCIENYDYYVVNGRLSEAVEDTKAILRSEHLKVGDEGKNLIKKYEEEIINAIPIN